LHYFQVIAQYSSDSIDSSCQYLHVADGNLKPGRNTYDLLLAIISSTSSYHLYSYRRFEKLSANAANGDMVS